MSEPPCYGSVRPVVWGAGVKTSRLPDYTALRHSHWYTLFAIVSMPSTLWFTSSIAD